jgi:hypothetical protein
MPVCSDLRAWSLIQCLRTTPRASGLRCVIAAYERLACDVQDEGSLWRAVGLLTAGGALRTAVLTLRRSGMADCAHAYVAACAEAGITSDGTQDCGAVSNLFHHTGNSPVRAGPCPTRMSSGAAGNE